MRRFGLSWPCWSMEQNTRCLGCSPARAGQASGALFAAGMSPRGITICSAASWLGLLVIKVITMPRSSTVT